MKNNEQEIFNGLKKYSGDEKLEIKVNPGTASPEKIAELLVEISILYRMMGGSGLTFSKGDIKAYINI